MISRSGDSCDLCGGSGQLPETVLTNSGTEHHPICWRCAALARPNAVSDEVKDERMYAGLALLLVAAMVGLVLQSASGSLLFGLLFMVSVLIDIAQFGSFFSDWAEVLAWLRKRPTRSPSESPSRDDPDDGSSATV